MINDGDKILVGISGGKDSLSLMWILKDRLKRIPVKYEIFPVYIDLGFDKNFGDNIIQYCKSIKYDLRVEWTNYGIISHSSQNRENPCFLCSMLRRKKLFEIAREFGCSKIALGHNKDDIIETLFLNILYAGEISTMLPYQTFFKGNLAIIRPFALSDKEVIRCFADENFFPEFINPCQSSKNSKRNEIRDFLKQFYQSNKKIKGNIFKAISNVKLDYLFS